MHPGPAFNWICVLLSASDILSSAASIRAAQISRIRLRILQNRQPKNPSETKRKRNAEGHYDYDGSGYPLPSFSSNSDRLDSSDNLENSTSRSSAAPITRTLDWASSIAGPSKIEDVVSTQSKGEAIETTLLGRIESDVPISDTLLDVESTSPQLFKSKPELLQDRAYANGSSSSDVKNFEPKSNLQASASSSGAESTDSSQSGSADFALEHAQLGQQPQRTLQASRVPSSRIGRLFHYGGLAASLGYGAAAEVLRRTSGSGSGETSLMMTSANISRLVSKLSKMRGAALKLGQFMSIQDSHMLPKEVEEVFRKVQDSAHYMPNWQMERVMSTSFGTSWRENFTAFDAIPFAAASLGQVHAAVLSKSVSPTGKDVHIAVKVQFPDIRKSIENDLGYLRMLLAAAKILPSGLFLDRTIKVMREELADECDYTREAAFIRIFGSNERLGKDQRFRVPWVWDGSTGDVLVMERMRGVSVGGAVVDRLDKADRDKIASGILELCMRELFEFRMMQTDPNWTNFLWNERTKQIELLDFGATREYSKDFMDDWFRLLQAAVVEDRDACITWSRELGYLTGEENETMLDAHIRSLTLLATPFRAHPDRTHYPFGRETEWARITAEIRSLVPVMLRHRLTPPPRETYSLNRKLSGAFLLASRLNASVNCRNIWENTVRGYKLVPKKGD